MNNDAEAIKQLFAWLLHELDPATATPSGKDASHETRTAESGAFYSQSILDSLDSNGTNGLTTPKESSSFPFRQISSLEFGEIPAVQDRFQALLKRRLRAEIERNPPRFPWETGAFDYDSEYLDVSPSDLIPAQIWVSQLESLSLPVPVPEQVLAQLFEQCREMVMSSLQEGAKLVKAVEALFPGQHQALNQLAGLVLAAPLRSGRSALQSSTSTSAFPSHYDVATPTQQMALSLIAAREILNTMTLRLSLSQPRVERNWLTDVGALALEATYQPEVGQIQIQGMLPCQGRLSLRGALAQSTALATAQAAEAGSVTVELHDFQPNQTYFLEVQLGDEPSPLVFAVCLATEE
jgi:hypothetical protein